MLRSFKVRVDGTQRKDRVELAKVKHHPFVLSGFERASGKISKQPVDQILEFAQNLHQVDLNYSQYLGKLSA
jgi:hypothetical protein